MLSYFYSKCFWFLGPHGTMWNYTLSEKRENTKGAVTSNICGREENKIGIDTMLVDQVGELFPSAPNEEIRLKAGPRQNLLRHLRK